VLLLVLHHHIHPLHDTRIRAGAICAREHLNRDDACSLSDAVRIPRRNRCAMGAVEAAATTARDDAVRHVASAAARPTATGREDPGGATPKVVMRDANARIENVDVCARPGRGSICVLAISLRSSVDTIETPFDTVMRARAGGVKRQRLAALDAARCMQQALAVGG
jgi:hypothetical protein